jgi:hypothetical protein
MRHRPSASELLAWTLVGTAVGLVAGFALGEWLGPVTKRPRRGLTSPGADGGAPGPVGVAETTRRALAALAGDSGLRALPLTAIAVNPGTVELHGWVASRAERARAARLVAATPGITTLVNCLLVHGEDDAPHAAPHAADQPA